MEVTDHKHISGERRARGKKKTSVNELIYRLIKVQDEAQEEGAAAFKLKTNRGNVAHKLNQLQH